jgi:hypothetical protein
VGSVALAIVPGRLDGDVKASRSYGGDLMRRHRALFLAILAALLALSVAVPVSAVTFNVKAIVKENFERAPSNVPCVFDEVALTITCPGSGHAGRFGHFTSSAVYGTTSDVWRTLTFADGSSLVLHEVWDDPTFPGNSREAPGGLISFGNPFGQEGTWTVVPGSGTDGLDGASGSGTFVAMGAGNTFQVWFTGTITTP